MAGSIDYMSTYFDYPFPLKKLVSLEFRDLGNSVLRMSRILQGIFGNPKRSEISRVPGFGEFCAQNVSHTSGDLWES
ncbi:hypothetical protein Y032_0937g3121 [Ancylostoma ceylanicum]|uniref:Uncharacterized protein n=1 Tax=Ancylostoma ceylanicum TaxID=53326 RepID=A0A016W8C5_9BILA|nr:hypothetical protein Y032_0937g3121 [Ancylostoma ceylanicum]